MGSDWQYNSQATINFSLILCLDSFIEGYRTEYLERTITSSFQGSNSYPGTQFLMSPYPHGTCVAAADNQQNAHG